MQQQQGLQMHQTSSQGSNPASSQQLGQGFTSNVTSTLPVAGSNVPMINANP